MRLIVTGATGLAGAEVVRQSLADAAIQKVTALVRRALTLNHPKLATVVHQDFLNYDLVLPQLANHDACLWCLGVSQRDVAEPEYVRITRDYTLAGAAAMLRVNPGLDVRVPQRRRRQIERARAAAVREGQGTDRESPRRTRPAPSVSLSSGLHRAVRTSSARAVRGAFLLALHAILHRLLPSSLITSADLARAMIYAVTHGADQHILDNLALRRLAHLAAKQ